MAYGEAEDDTISIVSSATDCRIIAACARIDTGKFTYKNTDKDTYKDCRIIAACARIDTDKTTYKNTYKDAYKHTHTRTLTNFDTYKNAYKNTYKNTYKNAPRAHERERRWSRPFDAVLAVPGQGHSATAPTALVPACPYKDTYMAISPYIRSLYESSN